MEHTLYRYFAKRAVRDYFDRAGFIEIDAPSLILANAPDPFIDPLIVRSID